VEEGAFVGVLRKTERKEEANEGGLGAVRGWYRRKEVKVDGSFVDHLCLTLSRIHVCGRSASSISSRTNKHPSYRIYNRRRRRR